MREAIHPEYHKVQAVCVCGNTIDTGSTLSEIRLDVCSACHPFYTGTQKIMDTEGRVDKFKKRYENRAAQPAKKDKTRKEKPQAGMSVLNQAPQTEVETKPGEAEVKTAFNLADGTAIEVEAEIEVNGATTLLGKPETRISQNDRKVEVKTWFELTDGTEIEVEGELTMLDADAEVTEVQTSATDGEFEAKRVVALKSGQKVELEAEVEVRGGKALQGQPAINIESKDDELELKVRLELEDGTVVNVESEIEFKA